MDLLLLIFIVFHTILILHFDSIGFNLFRRNSLVWYLFRWNLFLPLLRLNLLLLFNLWFFISLRSSFGLLITNQKLSHFGLFSFNFLILLIKLSQFRVRISGFVKFFHKFINRFINSGVLFCQFPLLFNFFNIINVFQLLDILAFIETVRFIFGSTIEFECNFILDNRLPNILIFLFEELGQLLRVG